MKNRKELEQLSDQGNFMDVSSLEKKLEKVIAAYETKLDTQFDRAEQLATLQESGPVSFSMIKNQQKLEASQVENSDLPIVTRFDAYSQTQETYGQNKSDHGLRMASHLLYNRWMEDPTGSMSLGELSAFRNQIVDRFPITAAKELYDETLVEDYGFHTLKDLAGLKHIASQVVDQDSYENAIIDCGLDGDEPYQIRARAFIRGMVEAGVSNHTAQVMAEDELELPHDEMDEEMAQIESPASGAELVVELSEKLDRIPDDIEYTEAEPVFENAVEVAQGMDELNEDEMESDEGFDSEAQMMDMDDEGLDSDSMPVDPAMNEESSTFIVDPTTGDTLLLTLKIVDEPGSDMVVVEDSEISDSASEELPHTDAIVATICAHLGATSDAIETALLNGETVEYGSDVLLITAEDKVEHRTASVTNRKTFLADMDQVILDFQRKVASHFSVSNLGKPKTNISTVPTSFKRNHTLIATLPQGNEKLASRVMGQVWKICAEAEAALDEDDTNCITISLPNCDYADLTRVAKILREKFAAKKVTAQTSPVTNGQPADLNAPVEDLTKTDPNSPYNGQSPIQKVPAGTPMKPMQTGQQTMQTGQAQSEVDKKNTAPMKAMAQLDWEDADEGEEVVMVSWPPEHIDISPMQYWWSGMGDIMYMLHSTSNDEVPLHEVERGLRQLERDFAKVPAEDFEDEAENAKEDGPLMQTEMLIQDLKEFIAKHQKGEKQASQNVTAELIDVTELPNRDSLAFVGMDFPALKILQKATDVDSDLLSEAQIELDGLISKDTARGHSDNEIRPKNQNSKLIELYDAMSELLKGSHQAQLADEPEVSQVRTQLDEMNLGDVAVGDTNDSDDVKEDHGAVFDQADTGLEPQDMEATMAAMEHFRNVGDSPLEALDDFMKKYEPMLEKYGDSTDPKRMRAEAGVISAMTKAFSKPAIIPVTK